MKQLIRKPFLFAMLLSLPLWVVFNNYLIAVISALLIAFLASMCHSLYVLRTPTKGSVANGYNDDDDDDDGDGDGDGDSASVSTEAIAVAVAVAVAVDQPHTSETAALDDTHPHA